MQKCLQTPTLVKKAAKTALAVLAITVSAAVPIAVKLDNNPLKAQISQSGKHMYQTIVDSGTRQLNSLNLKDENGQKMNNFESEVAKTMFSKENSVDYDVISDRNVRVLTAGDKVEQMPLEEYIIGCVCGEMPLSFESQAIMAQGVAARSFTVRQMIAGTSKHKNADVCTNPACCQNFISPDSLQDDQRKLLSDAVNATKGMIMTYDGFPIEAVYHASSGSETLDSEDVWGGKVEYLRSVKSPDGETAISVSGMGHRVGMSQHGANLLAKEGKNYMEILKYYYSGIGFDFLT